MLTRCPACAVWFRVRAEHLSAAAGYVTCGACDTVFNALATLVEEAPPSVWAGPAPLPVSSPPEPVAAPETRQTHSPSSATDTASSGHDAAPSADPFPPPPPPASGAIAAQPQQSESQGAAERATDWMRYALPERDHPPPWAAVTDPPAQEEPVSAAVWLQPVEPAAAEPELQSAPAAARRADSEIEFAVALLREERAAPDHAELTTALNETTPDAHDEPQSLDVHAALAGCDDEQPLPQVVDAPERPIDERMTSLSDDACLVDERASTTTAAGAAIRDAGDESDPEPPADEPAVREDERHTLSAQDPRLERDDEPIPELLRNEIIALEREQQRTPRRGLLWGLGCTALVLVLVAQLLYVYRDGLIARWPAAAPLVADLCAEFGCPATNQTIASPVELLARDVREHPQYHDALLVNATLVNSSASAAPFPVLELVLHDAAGGIIGARRFAPEEYLDHSIAIDAGMSPAQPVYIVIELGGSTAAATSFEFSFM